MLKKGMPPVHPGEILKEMYLDPMGITVTEFAQGLKVARRTVSLIINGHSGISAEMALRLSKAFDTTAEFWLNLQRNHDLWQASQKISLSGIRHWVAAKRTTGIGKRA
ncbi:MAG TPA: HigA family addiction module antitoxin [Daejeonella sp.]